MLTCCVDSSLLELFFHKYRKENKMSLQEIELPDHVVQGEELEEIWDRLMSFSNAVVDLAGVEIEELNDDVIGDYKIIHLNNSL